MEVSEAIGQVIYPKVAGKSNTPEITAGFERMGFPYCAGAIDGIYVTVVSPSQGARIHCG